MEGILTIQELMKEFGIARSTVYKYIDLGMPYIQMGSTRIFKYDDVKPWIDNRR